MLELARALRLSLLVVGIVGGVAFAPPAGPRQDASSSPERWAEGVQEKLAAEEWSEAFEVAERALEFHPEDVGLLTLAFRAALESGERDLALVYGELALEQWSAVADPTAKAPPAQATEIQSELATLDPLGRAGEKVLAEYRTALFEAGKTAAKRKLFVNAVDLLTRSRDLGLGAAAEAELAKIYENKQAVQALLATGLDVPLRAKKSKKSAEAIAKEDLARRDWAKAYEIKGDNYTVRTNMGAEMANSISSAMEQVNRFYRKVFKVRERGGNTARVTVSVYKSRAEFDEYEKLDEKKKNVLAFFVPNQNRVAAYDLREHGYAIGELWSTLFHEASHQFTHLVSADLIPGWLNEGTASYFEGARLLPNGTVETNLIPEERLLYLELSLQKGDPTLKDVVTYYQPGSYDGSYYPFGWGLVYFLLNYEDESCERIYAPLYQEYMATYGSGGKHDVFGRFVEHFVTKAKQPSVKTFEDFEARWKAWILELHALHFGDASKADALIERGRKQAKNGKLEAAIESYRWALRKRPGDATAQLELGDLLAGRKETDAALFYYRNALVAARSKSNGTTPLIERASAQTAKLDEALGKSLKAADDKLLAACEATANGYVEREFGRTALRFLERARAASGGAASLAALQTRLAADGELDVRRWRRPVLDADLTHWETGKGWKRDGEGLFAQTSGVSFATWKNELPPRYRLEVRFASVDLEDDGFVALTFGERGEGLLYYGVGGPGLLEVGRLRKTWESIEEIGLLPPRALERLNLAIDVTPEKCVFWIEDEVVFEHAFSPDETPGRPGLVMQGGSAGFSEFRVLY
jgi:hypothetical protein